MLMAVNVAEVVQDVLSGGRSLAPTVSVYLNSCLAPFVLVFV